MEKDAEKLIEISSQDNLSSISNVESFLRSTQNKYQGEDNAKFMEIVKKKVLEQKAKGKDCGWVELMYIWDKDFQELKKDK